MANFYHTKKWNNSKPLWQVKKEVVKRFLLEMVSTTHLFLHAQNIGIAMGGVGSDAAIEAADVVIMTDEISKVATAIKIARKTHQIVWQNIIFALGVKGVILIMGAFGIATMWEAVFGDVGVALIAVLNASRVLRKEY